MDKARIDLHCPERCVESLNMEHQIKTMNKSDRSEQSKCSRTLIAVQTRALKRPCRISSNRTLISLAIISYIISNQIFMTALIGSIRLFSTSNCDTGSIGLKSAGDDRSLIKLVTASPAPAPLRAASARSATSQRVPPVNGSMFGKRDLSSRVNEHRSQLETSSDAQQYSDVITEVIENFMARNDEGNPEETTAAFCRMIIYECSKFSHSRKKGGSNRKITR